MAGRPSSDDAPIHEHRYDRADAFDRAEAGACQLDFVLAWALLSLAKPMPPFAITVLWHFLQSREPAEDFRCHWPMQPAVRRHRWFILASAAFLTVALGHFIYHGVLFYRTLGQQMDYRGY